MKFIIFMDEVLVGSYNFPSHYLILLTTFIYLTYDKKFSLCISLFSFDILKVILRLNKLTFLRLLLDKDTFQKKLLQMR